MAEFNGKKVLLAGLKGEKGDPGPQGPQGEKGEPGSIEGASSVTLEGDSGSKVLVSAEEPLPYIVAEAGTDTGKQVLLSLHPATHLTENITLQVPAETGTLATQEYVGSSAPRFLDPQWQDDDSRQTVIPSYDSKAGLPTSVSALRSAFGLGAFDPTGTGLGYEVFVKVAGKLVYTAFVENGDGTIEWASDLWEELKKGDTISTFGRVMMVTGTAGGEIWRNVKCLRGRFPVMPLAYNNSLTLQDMRDCDIKVNFSAEDGTARGGWNVYSARNCSLLIDTTDYTENVTGGGVLACQARIYGDNATLIGGASPVLRDNAGNPPSMRSAVARVEGGSINLNLNYIQYDQNGVVAPNSEGTMCNNSWFVPFRPEWTYTDADGAQKDLRLNFRYEFAESGQPRMDVIPYIVPHVETAAASIATMSLAAEPSETAEPSVPSGRRGCFTLDEQGRTIDAFTGEVVE